jgi:hypothetical protein
MWGVLYETVGEKISRPMQLKRPARAGYCINRAAHYSALAAER